MRLYNTLSRQVEQLDFPEGIVRMYVCGITPYDTSHMGHARVGIVYDTLRRFLEYSGYDVRYVQNVTDIDDPLFERAQRDNIAWDVLAQRETERYLQSLARVNVPKPRFYVKASEVIDVMQPIIQRLVDGGHAYATAGYVYYDVRSFPQFGAMFSDDYEQMLETANERGNDPNDPHKRDPLDFVLWQPSKKDEPSWPSPWGDGKPGWHIECSTIATHYLGPQVDIHGGGEDLIFPHHAAEIAQAEPANEVTPFVRCWMHVGMIHLDGEKMSKSLGNMVFVPDVLERFQPDALRLSVLSHPYREEYTYTDEDVQHCQEFITKLRHTVSLAKSNAGGPLDGSDYHAQFIAALNNDFDTPRAIATLDEFADHIQAAANDGLDIRKAQSTLRELTQILGLTLE